MYICLDLYGMRKTFRRLCSSIAFVSVSFLLPPFVLVTMLWIFRFSLVLFRINFQYFSGGCTGPGYPASAT